jgi:hypothetical protein
MLHKIVCISVIGSFLMACNSPKQEPKQEEVREGIVMSDNTEFNYPEVKIPEGYYFDNITHSDTVKAVDYHIEFIKGKDGDVAEYNRAIALALVDEIDKSLSGYDIHKHPDYCPVYSEVYAPIKFYSGETYISTIFVNDSYSGGVHHNYSWYGLNYCKKERRMVWCKDVFKFRTKKDSMDFKRMVGRNLEYPLDLSEDSDSVAFYILDEGMEIYPNLGWANGMHGANLSFDSLRPYLTKQFTLKFNGKR